MRIFLISNMYPSKDSPDFGIFVKNFQIKLGELGARFPYVAVIHQKNKGSLQKLRIYLKHYFSIFKFYIKNDYDIIYIHYLSHNAPIFILILSFLRKKTPIVVNVHGSDIIKYNSGFLKISNEFLLKRTNLIVVPSSYFLEIMVNEFSFLKEENILVNPSGGIDFNVFYPTKQENSLNEEILKIGFVSRIEEGKGWDIYLEALSILKKKNIKFKAIIAGNGNQINKMLNEINKLQLTNEVEYLGVLEQKKLRDVYSTLDIFVFCSIRAAESLGLVGLEAMACGTPIIASDMAGPKTYVKNNINGYLFPPGNSEEIAEVLVRYYNLSLGEKKVMTKEAITTAKEYDSDATANSLYGKLERLCSF